MNRKKSTLIIQSNHLIEARYHLTVAEQRLIFAMISMIDLNDEDFKSYKIQLTDLADIWDIEQDVIYREAKKITARLMKRLLEITESDGTMMQVHWVCLAVHKPGYITLQFHPLLKPYLLQLKGAFTKCSLQMLNQFQSIYTIRIYQLLTQYKSIGSRTFVVDELRKTLGIEENQYKVFKDFKRRVLDQARKELDMKADLTFDLEGIVKGKKTHEIILKILDKSTALTVKDTHKPSKNSLGKAAERVVQSAVKAELETQEKPISRINAPKYWKQYREYAVKKNDKLLLILIDSGEWDAPVIRCEYEMWERDIYLKCD